jgi:hypothetical protein
MISWAIPWKSPNRYIIHWRRTDANQWTERSTTPAVCTEAASPSDRHCQITLKGIRVDDWVFGVSSVGKEGFESPVASAVPGGAFRPYIVPDKK